MDRRVIGLIWLSGIVLMVAIYAIGPQHVITALGQFVANAMWWLDDLIDILTLRGFEAVRAAAIALYVVLVGLAVLAARRGVPSGGILLVVSVVLLLLLGTGWVESGSKWLACAVLTAVAAGMLTKRLTLGPHPRDPADPWGVAARSGGHRSGSPWAPSTPRPPNQPPSSDPSSSHPPASQMSPRQPPSTGGA